MTKEGIFMSRYGNFSFKLPKAVTNLVLFLKKMTFRLMVV